MVPGAEVGIIMASLGLSSGVIGRHVYPVVLPMLALTWIATPAVPHRLLGDWLPSR